MWTKKIYLDEQPKSNKFILKLKTFTTIIPFEKLEMQRN